MTSDPTGYGGSQQHSFLAYTVTLFTLKINKAHGFLGDICSPRLTVGPQGKAKAEIGFHICTCREICYVASETRPGAVRFKPWLTSTAGKGCPCGPYRGKMGLMIQCRISVIISQPASSCASPREDRVKKTSCSQMWCIVTHLCRQVISQFGFCPLFKHQACFGATLGL